MARWKGHVNFLFALMNFFRYLLRFRSYEAKCVQLGCFHRGPQGSTSLHSNFTQTESFPSIILGVRKLETLGYPKAKTASLCIPSFWHYTGVWRTDRRTDGRTNRRICRSIYSRLQSFAVRCKKNQGDSRPHWRLEWPRIFTVPCYSVCSKLWPCSQIKAEEGCSPK